MRKPGLAGLRSLAATLVLAAGLLAGSPAPAVELKREATSGLEYLEIVTGGGLATDPLPVVVAIHGLGDRPESFRLFLDDLPTKARVILPRGPMPHGGHGFSWFDFHTDDEEGARRLGEGVRIAALRVADLMIALAAEHGGPARGVVCGFSQGGMLSFAVAATRPDLVAVAVPVSGYLPTALWPSERPKTRPLPRVLALHGETDRVISAESARCTVEALRSNGFDSSLRAWPGVGHGMVPDIRAALVAAVVGAVEELSAPGTVLEGPPAPLPVTPTPKAAPPDAMQLTPDGTPGNAPSSPAAAASR
ncbi:MAG: alpha/beta hydrolase [Candidatus Binatia bacterium]